jgi:hypothetical protein
MSMKVKHILIAYLVSIVLILAGAMAKLNYLAGADILLNIGTGLKVLAILATIYKVVKSSKFKEILNS